MGNGFIKYLKNIVDCILELIYPFEETCIICKKEIEEGFICEKCSGKINFCEGLYYLEKEGVRLPCYSVTYYSSIMKELIIRLKYRGDFNCGKVIGNFMSTIIKKNNLKFDWITYVPSSRESLRKRGYNQSQYIGKYVGELIDVRLLECLSKNKKTKDQIGLDGINRWINLENAFGVKKEKKILGKRILLIDDVITTGATAFYCAEILLKNGAEEVTILTGAKSKI